MKPIRIWYCILISIIALSIIITNLPNAQKASFYELTGQTFDENITSQHAVLNVISIEKTNHFYDKDPLFLVEYSPNKYVFLEANESNSNLKSILNGSKNKLAVNIISRYMYEGTTISRKFSFSESDIQDISSDKRSALLRSRLVSLSQFNGLRIEGLIWISAALIVITLYINMPVRKKGGHLYEK